MKSSLATEGGSLWAISEKIQTGVEDMEFPGVDFEERACGNWRGQLKKKCNFQGCSRKIHVEFPWVLTSKRNVEHNIFFIQEKVI